MNYWLALEVLGLEDDDKLTRDRVRRTYMRRLREHPPEKDPEGFQRLREAFEALRHSVPDEVAERDEAPAQFVINEARPAANDQRDDEPSPSRSGSRIIVSAAPNAATPSNAKLSGQWKADQVKDEDTGYSLKERIREDVGGKPKPLDETDRTDRTERVDADDDDDGGYSLSNPIREEIGGGHRKARSSDETEDSSTGGYSLSNRIREEIGGPKKAAPDDEDEDDDLSQREGGYSLAGDEIPDDDEEEDDEEEEEEEDDDDDSAYDEEDDGEENKVLGTNNALPLHELVDKVLILLEHDEVQEALALEARWRDHPDSDDHRMASDFTAVRWALTRELLAVASSLPAPVVSALAQGISVHDVSVARADLETYRRRNPEKAAEANGILAKRAPDLHKQIAGTLYIPPAREYFRQPDPPASYSSNSSSGSGFNAVWVILGVIVLIVRIAAKDSGSSRYSSHNYNIPDIPKFDTSYLERLERMPKIDYDKLYAPPSAPLILPDPDDKWSATNQIERSLRVLQEHPDISSEEQREAALLFSVELATEDCKRMRKQFGKLKSAQPAAVTEQYVASEHISAIEARLDILCKPVVKATAKKKPRKTTPNARPAPAPENPP